MTPSATFSSCLKASPQKKMNSRICPTMFHWWHFADKCTVHHHRVAHCHLRHIHLFILTLPCRCRHPCTCVRVSRQSLHTIPFLHKVHSAFWTRLAHTKYIWACTDPTLLLSHSAPRHATAQLRLSPNDDDHHAMLSIYVTLGFTSVSIAMLSHINVKPSS